VYLIKVEYSFSGDDVPVDSEVSIVTSSISRPDPPAQSSGGAHRGRVCVRVFIGMSVYTCNMSAYVYTVF
jgi:hypothetical protein